MNRFLLMLVLAILAVSPSLRADDQFVDPYSVQSDSKVWKLEVDPSSPGGEGGAKYRMSRGQEVVYQVELPFTLRECVVGDSGMAVGYEYDNGYMGWDGHVNVVALSGEGKVLMREEHRRAGPSLFVDPTPPSEPRVQGLIADQPGGRVIVRVNAGENKPDEWWIYSLEDGKPLGAPPLKPPAAGDSIFCRQIRALLVPGTPFVAAHWVIYDHGKYAAEFQLIDREGNAWWTSRIDGEYAGREKQWNWWQLIEDDVRQIEVEPGAFSITSYAEGKRRRYTLTQEHAGGWAVGEPTISEQAPKAWSTKSVIRQIPGQLIDKGTVTMGSAPARPVIDEIHSFKFDDQGRIGWVKWDRDPKPAQRFVLIDHAGKVIADRGLDFLPEDASLAVCEWLEKSRWILAIPGKDDEPKRTSAWFLDLDQQTLTPLPEFTSGHLKRICGTRDGGFIVLSSLFGNYTIRDQVQRFDREGKLVTSKTEPGYGQGDSIQDVAVLTDGSVATLCGVADHTVVRVSRADGGPANSWNVRTQLGEANGPEQNYFADIRADRDGGLIVYDSANRNHLHRFDRAGKVWQSFHVRGPKEEPFRLYDAFAVDPEGRVWASDGSRLYRCGKDGRADLTLGGPAEGAMASPVAVTIDARGWIYAIEKGTAAVHIFDDQGRAQRVLRPSAGSAWMQDALAWIRVAADGSVRYQMSYEAPIIAFDADGKQLASVESTYDPGAEERWEPVPGGPGWERTGSSLRRVGAEGRIERTIRHRPDGAWIETIEDAHAGPDGTLVLLCSRPDPASWLSIGGPRWLCTYGPNGRGEGCLKFDSTSYFPSVGHQGRRVLLMDEHGLMVFPANGPLPAEARAFTLEGGDNHYWKILPRPDGSIAAWDSGAYELRRFEIPE